LRAGELRIEHGQTDGRDPGRRNMALHEVEPPLKSRRPSSSDMTKA
jgi:hypothetical protein